MVKEKVATVIEVYEKGVFMVCDFLPDKTECQELGKQYFKR